MVVSLLGSRLRAAWNLARAFLRSPRSMYEYPWLFRICVVGPASQIAFAYARSAKSNLARRS